MVVENKNNIETSSRHAHQHPLDPLSYEEINISSEIVKSKASLGAEILFETIVIREPDKELILKWEQGKKRRWRRNNWPCCSRNPSLFRR